MFGIRVYFCGVGRGVGVESKTHVSVNTQYYYIT